MRKTPVRSKRFIKISGTLILIIVLFAIGIWAARFKIFESETALVSEESSIAEYRRIETARIAGELNFPFKRPFGLALDAADNIYVSEFYQQKGDEARILKFSPEGNYLGWTGKGDKTTGWHAADSRERSLPGAGDGEFVGVSRIAFHPDGRAFVLDGASTDPTSKRESGNHRIQIFDKDWNFLGWIGKGQKTLGWHGPDSGETGRSGTEDGALATPDGLLVTDQEVLVGSWASFRVDRFSTEGEHLGWLGKAEDGSYGWHVTGSGLAKGAPIYGEEVGAFQTPIGIARDDYNRLYVTDFSSDPVLSVFDYDTGNFIWGIWRKEGMRPDNVIVDRYGNIILSDYSEGSIRFLDKDGNKAATIQFGPGGEYFGAAAFAFDSKGNLYVTEFTKGKVYRIELVYH